MRRSGGRQDGGPDSAASIAWANEGGKGGKGGEAGFPLDREPARPAASLPLPPRPAAWRPRPTVPYTGPTGRNENGGPADPRGRCAATDGGVPWGQRPATSDCPY